MRKSMTITVKQLEDDRIAVFFQSGSEPMERFIRVEPSKWVAGYGCRLHREYEKVCEDLLEKARIEREAMDRLEELLDEE